MGILSMKAFGFLGLVVVGLISMASAEPGTATFYTEYVPSACYGYEDQGVMIAAASPEIFNNRAACGRMYNVRCTGPTNQGIPQPCKGKTVNVKIVDLCPGCKGRSLDLSKQAFSWIANPDAGRIRIEFNQV
ncbi:EG45-like domain containing protein [Tripterygium wilfordii]|uniref:EG45-like domain containing protein n=1 Tax=Tripterygium wilfordii TaxID=458696 RepID=UPI0018F7E9DD|nr:EG45-like domain containing protein [Tripterygium wilfordii]